jgi:hypothetical protein
VQIVDSGRLPDRAGDVRPDRGGSVLPDGVAHFLAAVTRAFDLSEGDERRLVLRLAHDLVALELGDWADSLF